MYTMQHCMLTVTIPIKPLELKLLVISRRKVDDTVHTFSMQIPIPPPSRCSFIANTYQFLFLIYMHCANLWWQKCAL